MNFGSQTARLQWRIVAWAWASLPKLASFFARRGKESASGSLLGPIHSMPPKIVFVDGDSIKTIKDRDKRRKIRSDIIKRSWASQNSRRSRIVTGSAAANVSEAQQVLLVETGVRKSPCLRPQDGAAGVLGHSSSPIMSPTCLLSASRSDPFRCFGLEPNDHFNQSILDYCKRPSI